MRKVSIWDSTPNGLRRQRRTASGVSKAIAISRLKLRVEERPDAPIGAASTRQAAAHAQWVRANHEPAAGIPVVAVLVTSRKTAVKDALALAGDLRCCTPDAIRGLARETTAAMRTTRAEAGGADQSLLLEKVQALYGRAGLDPSAVQRRLESVRVVDLPVV
jgi:hypothetical protein